MAVFNARSIKPFVWIPPIYYPTIKLTIEYSNGTVEDITEKITQCNVEDWCTNSVGMFDFTILDPENTYINLIKGNEIIRYYKDYDTSATTLRFRGRVEQPKRKEFAVQVKGRSESLRLLTIKATESYLNVDTSDILRDLMTKYASWVSLTNIENSNVYISIQFNQKPILDCIQLLCQAAAYEYYVDANNVANYFLSGSKPNAEDAIVHDINLLSVEEFTEDLTQKRNKVTVYGATIDGIQTIYTASIDDTSGIIREEIIQDDSVTTYEQAQQLGEFTLNQLKNPPLVGAATSVMLGTIRPGQNLRISVPYSGIVPTSYFISGTKDEIDYTSGKYSTKVTINKEPRKVSEIIKQRIQRENQRANVSLNPYGLPYSYNFLYNTDEGTHSNTQIANGILKLASAGTGYWISPPRTLDKNINSAYLILVGQSLDQVTVEVSGNGGNNYQTVTPAGNKITINTVTGKNLVVKISFTSSTTAQVDSVSILYGTE